MRGYILFIHSAAAACVLLCSCNSIVDMFTFDSVPEGNAPEGPIIKEGKAEAEPEIPGSRSAVNYMVTSISTRCAPISSAGKELPRTANEFIVSDGAVNELPMEVWRSLIRMKLITPTLTGETDTLYSLTSEFKELPGDKMFLWEMRLISAKTKEVLWSDKFIFKASGRE